MESIPPALGDDTLPPAGVTDDVKLVFKKLSECQGNLPKRCKERLVDEAVKLLKEKVQLQSLERSHLVSLTKLLVAVQMEAASTSSLCRKLDQMIQLIGEVSSGVALEEVQRCINAVMHSDLILSIKDLQYVSMFLECSCLGQRILRQQCLHLLSKVSEVFSSSREEDKLRNETLCYQAVKVCLQIFQSLSEEVYPMVFGRQSTNSVLASIVGFLMDIVLGWSANKDTRLLAGTAVGMLINTAPEEDQGRTAAWSVLQFARQEPWQMTVGGLQVQCHRKAKDGLEKLALCRGVLTACRKDILAHGQHPTTTCLLLDMFPVVSAVCEDSLDNLYYAFQVFSLWLKCLKVCLPSVMKLSSGPLLGPDSSLQRPVIDIIWNNAESPIEGITESVRSALCLFLEIYESDCQHSGAEERPLYQDLLHHVTKLPWDTKAKYIFLCALLPYLGTEVVLKHYSEFPVHLLKCLSTNQLSPWASEVYIALVQDERKEMCRAQSPAPPSELKLAAKWSQRWRGTLLEALTSDSKLLQTNAVSHLLPATLQTYPSAFNVLLDGLDHTSQRDLRAWTCIMSCQRVVCERSSWISEDGCVYETLQSALTSLDDGVRLAALNMLCCSSKSKERPSALELSAMRSFIPLNLNSEAPAFRQQLYASAKKFLCRVRDTCLAAVLKGNSKKKLCQQDEDILCQGVEFVDWLAELAFLYLNPGSNYQRKKTALLLLSAVLETCTDTWSPDKRKGQPPVNILALITWARSRGLWDFFSTSKQLALISCMEDMTDEIRELSSELLIQYFPKPFPEQLTHLVFSRAELFLHSPRAQEAQIGALMMKVLLQKEVDLSQPWVNNRVNGDEANLTSVCQYLLELLEQQYLTAMTDMLGASQKAPMHGAATALQRCLLEVPGVLQKEMDAGTFTRTLGLIENITTLILGVLYGEQDTESKEVPPSYCEMGKAITSVIGQQAGSDGEEVILLSEEHSLVLTCCWVSLKEIGTFLGSLVERLSSLAESVHLLTVDHLRKVSKVFKDIILKCRHWGAVEGCCRGFTKFCSTLLLSADPEVQDIPVELLKEGLNLLQSPRATSVTRRAAGLPMIFLCVVSAAESSRRTSLLSLSVSNLLEVANSPLPDSWDQTVDLPQVCAVHTLNTLVRGSSLGVAILKYCPDMAILALTLLSSPCWAVRNAALQLYSSLCTRMLGHSPGGDHASPQCGMCPLAFFTHYPSLLPFLLNQLRTAAAELHSPSKLGRLCVHPSLYPVLILLAKLQPGLQTETRELSEAVPPLLQLSSSPVYCIRVMASKALVALMPCSKYLDVLLKLVGELPSCSKKPFSHNHLHGQLLQIRAILTQVLLSNKAALSSLDHFTKVLESKLWLVTWGQQCHMIRGMYLEIVRLVRTGCSEDFLHQLCELLHSELHTPPHCLQIGSDSFFQTVVTFLCDDPVWMNTIWQTFSSWRSGLKMCLLKWAVEERGASIGVQHLLGKTLQVNLKEVLQKEDCEVKGVYLKALLSVAAGGLDGSASEEGDMRECAELLLTGLEVSDRESDYCSQALCAASLLLYRCLDDELLPRWCSILECLMSPESVETLRMACADSLCLAGCSLMHENQTDNTHKLELRIRLINVGLCLLQDQSERVRVKAAIFVSKVWNSSTGASTAVHKQKTSTSAHANQSIHLLLRLVLDRYWDHSGTLQLLLRHLPESQVSSYLRKDEAKFSSLYERDNPNVYAEPSAIAECLLPSLLQLALKYSESSALAQRLDLWVNSNLTPVLENLADCKKFASGLQNLQSSWMRFLSDPLLYNNLCGLFTRAIFLNQLLVVSTELQTDTKKLSTDLLDIYRQLRANGCFLPQTFADSILRFVKKSETLVIQDEFS
ncbi:tRNA (32-2'-O)-methyltransferase regulator THADA [Engraulis encrasicolus]|uniref:tRNA (32-2'-O)-methyltransferase regulator THADA n=1 Tax=Engraulis encrasicolus TaxID=184585 RepID=UPI002FD77DA4